MDALHMSAIPDGCFDLIIDKGLLDAQLCSDNNIDDVTALVKEMYRVLTPGERGLCMLCGMVCDVAWVHAVRCGVVWCNQEQVT
jgi:ubiquinone/menaquinone biosynthesis C-methylase UbiE